MNIRVIVPITWESELRIPLFQTLKSMGYTWSKGDSLDSDYSKLHNMAYIAINVGEQKCSYSSKIDIIKKPVSDCGLNYILSNLEINNIIGSINYIKSYLIENPTETELRKFVETQYELKDLFMLL